MRKEKESIKMMNQVCKSNRYTFQNRYIRREMVKCKVTL